MGIVRVLFLFITANIGFSAEVNVRLKSLAKSFSALNTSNEVVKFPSGTRATKTKDGFVIYNQKSNRYELYSLKDKSVKEIKIPTICKMTKSNTEVFFNEAREAIDQIKKSNLIQCQIIYKSLVKDYPDSAKAYENCDEHFKKSAPEFYSLMNNVDKKLEIIRESGKARKVLNDKLKKHNEKLFFTGSPAHKITKFESLLKLSYNPSTGNKKFSDSTLTIPITLNWINSNPEIKKWYEREWIGKKVLSPFKGKSGEGITQFANAELHKQMKEKLLELQKFVLAQSLSEIAFGMKKQFCDKCGEDQKHALANTFEYNWLINMELKDKSRLIFIHDQTVQKEDSQWQDYIPTDQSISCFNSNSLFSTIIHEFNVNSDAMEFFPDDTHGGSSDKSVTERLGTQDDNLHVFKSLVSREHYIQLIYLKTILDD